MNLSLSLIIPVFNEEKRLSKTFTALENLSEKHLFSDLEIIFVNDGSTDSTLGAIKKFKSSYPVKILSHEENQGKGFAVKKGMAAASLDYCLLFDADMSTPLSEVEKMIPFMENKCPVIIGTRKSFGSLVIEAQPWYRRKLGGIYTLIANLITGVWVSDFTCGFKCFSKQAQQQIFPLSRIKRWSYDAEILFLAKKSGLIISEVPVVWHNDIDTRVRLAKDIFGSFADLLKIRFGDYSK